VWPIGGIKAFYFKEKLMVLQEFAYRKNQAAKNESEIDEVGMIMAFEQGELDMDQVIVLFQRLVDTGLAWKLQGCYGRAAKALLDKGYIHQRTNSADVHA
jgi:hypothetical protein